MKPEDVSEVDKQSTKSTSNWSSTWSAALEPQQDFTDRLTQCGQSAEADGLDRFFSEWKIFL